MKDIKSFLDKEDSFQFLIKTVGTIHVGNDPIIALLILSGLSSGLKDRKKLIHVNCVGKSGKGKSAIQDHTGLIFSKMEVVTSSSAKATLYKASAGKLPDGGIIRFDEAEASSEAIPVERALTDRSLNNPAHETLDDKKKFKRLEITQINAVWRNSVGTPKDDQLNNRYLIVNVDESKEQDQAVFNKQIEEYCFGQEINIKDKKFEIAKKITDKIKEEPIKILIPYGNLIDLENKGNRRSLQKFFSILWNIIYCYRFQREQIREYYIATKKDAQIALELWNHITQYEAFQLPDGELRLLELITDNPIDAKKLQKKLEIAFGEIITTRTVKNRADNLLDYGIINGEYAWDEIAKTKKWFYWGTGRSGNGLEISIDWDKFTQKALEQVINKDGRKTLSKREIQNLYEKILQTAITEPFLPPQKNRLKMRSEAEYSKLKNFQSISSQEWSKKLITKIKYCGQDDSIREKELLEKISSSFQISEIQAQKIIDENIGSIIWRDVTPDGNFIKLCSMEVIKNEI